MTLEQFYAVSGGDLNAVLQRIPRREFLLKMLKKFEADPSKSTLDRAIEAKDPVEAFRAVHTLKGVTLTLGLSALSEACIALTEDLRPGDFGTGWEFHYMALCTEYDQTLSDLQALEG